MEFKLEESIGFLLHRTDTRAKAALIQALRPYHLTPEQWGIINQLVVADGVSQKELARRMCKDQPTTARILAKLEPKGTVIRMPDPGDARTTLVYLTAKGRSLQREIVPLVIEVLGRALQGFSEDEVATLKAMLNRVYANLE